MNIDTALFRKLIRFFDNRKNRALLKRRLQGMPIRELDRLAWDIGTTRTQLIREAHRPFWKRSAEPRSRGSAQ